MANFRRATIRSGLRLEVNSLFIAGRAVINNYPYLDRRQQPDRHGELREICTGLGVFDLGQILALSFIAEIRGYKAASLTL
jgi:hypothetical protein